MRAITNEVNENYPDTDGRKGEERYFEDIYRIDNDDSTDGMEWNYTGDAKRGDLICFVRYVIERNILEIHIGLLTT